jgi:hypothetical protein
MFYVELVYYNITFFLLFYVIMNHVVFLFLNIHLNIFDDCCFVMIYVYCSNYYDHLSIHELMYEFFGLACLLNGLLLLFASLLHSFFIISY